MKNKITDASAADLKNGFLYDGEKKIYTCLFCGTQYLDGDIYKYGNRLINADTAVKLHLSEKHGGVFSNLLASDKAQTGLTDTQKNYLSYSYSGLSDKEIAEKMDISASTVRYQRYNFKEKANQAKMILALYELLEEKNREQKSKEPENPANEETKMLETLFVSLDPPVLKTFDMKKKKEEKRQLILKTIVMQFEKDKIYSNKEVDSILEQIYRDYATIRRSLIDYGFMGRTSDCREYWRKQ